MCIYIDDLGIMLTSTALLGLLIVNSSQPASGESTGRTQGMLRFLTSGWVAGTVTMWSQLSG